MKYTESAGKAPPTLYNVTMFTFSLQLLYAMIETPSPVESMDGGHQRYSGHGDKENIQPPLQESGRY
jgi:hypothetical protein